MIDSATFSPGLYRHRALVDDHAITGEHAGDFARDLLDVTEVDTAVGILRSWHGNENHLRVIDPVLNAAAEAQPLGGNVAMHDLFQAGFVNRHLALLERFDFAGVVIDADDIMTDVGETGARDEADVT